jgi:CheY-like chemotaxis protein
VAVLMDCQMPVMDGVSATAEIRKREQRLAGTAESRHLPVIAVTANALAADRQRCLAAGMDDFLAKPLRSDELSAALKRWVVEDHSHRLESLPPAAAPDVDARAVSPDRASADLPAPALQVSGAIDPAAVERLRSFQPGVAEELAEVFLTQSPLQLATLRDAARSGELLLLWRTAHTLKGDAAAWGASDLERCCAEIETLSLAESVDGYDEPLAALAHELARVTEALRELGAPAKSIA